MRHSPIWEREERCIASTSNENYNPLSHDYSKESENYTPLAVPDCFLCSLLQSQNDRLLEINQNLLKSLDNSNREKKEIKKSMTERTPGPLCKIIQKKREEIDSLKTDLQMALRENADLQWRSTTKNDENFEDLRGIIEYLEKRLELSEADSCSKDGDISKLNHKVTHLQSEVDGLRYKLQEEQTKMHWLTVYSEQSRAKFENDKRTPESEIDNLRFEVKILKSENEKLEENRRQSLQEKEKLSVIHSNELKLKEEEMKVLKKDVEKINLELQSLYAKEYEKNFKNTNQDSEILRLKYEVNDLKEEIHTLKKQADNLRLEKVQIQRKFEFDLKREDSRAASEINRLRQVILQLENQKYETDIASLSRKKGAALQRENEKRKLADQDSPEMQYLKEQVCNLKKEVNMLEKEAKRLHEEKIQDQRKGELGLKERDSQTRIAESEISRLKQVILQLENENIKHKSHISAISEAKENALHRQSQAELNMKTLTEEMQHMRERLLKQEDDNYRLQKELSEVCKEKDNALSFD
ncbi:ankycorbin-like [Saccostrea cucullata]|uniref:ankycorbin-like n=1 Tax=Saccostrea cuccullata TaxID=36930 RepID=UPI002ED1DB64